MSKGSGRRPQQVSREEYDRRWAETFGGGGSAEQREKTRIWRRTAARIAAPFMEVNALCTGNVDDLPTPDFLDGYAPTEGE